MLESLRKVLYVDSIPQGENFFLAGDIGGTNTNFGIFELIEPKPRLLVSLHIKSNDVSDYTQCIKELCAYIRDTYGISIKEACFGAAGIVAENRLYAKPTNLSVSIDAIAIKKVTGISYLLLINDFEAVGLGIDLINSKDIVTINHGTLRPRYNKACIGAGTGMGKVALLWHHHFKRYIPLASEGGHEDCAGQAEHDLALFDFIKQEQQATCPISWEDILSGTGIQRMYRFLKTQKNYPETGVSKEIEQTRFDPDKISHYAHTDERCRDTFLLYAKFYARCAKNFVLDVLALNGIYIAGGIAAKNISIFYEPLFMTEFKACGKHSELLSQVPVYVIADYNVSLYGAVKFIQLRQQQVL